MLRKAPQFGGSMKLRRFVSLLAALFASSSFASESLNRAANIPPKVQQVGFSSQALLNAFSVRLEGHRAPERSILDLANLRYADLSTDSCINEKEYDLFLASAELQENADQAELRQQVGAFFVPWLHQDTIVESDNPLQATIDGFVRSEPTLHGLLLLQSALFRNQWVGQDGRWNKEETALFEKDWKTFRNTVNGEINAFIAEKRAELQLCEPRPGPTRYTEVFLPLEKAVQVGDHLASNLSRLPDFSQWDGKAGVGAFFGILGFYTRNPRDQSLSYRLLSEAFEDFQQQFRSNTLAQPAMSLINGVTGISYAALTVFRVTRDPKFLDLSLRAGEMVRLNRFTEYANGAAGIGLLWVRIYEVTRDEKWLKRAQDAGRYLQREAKRKGRIIWWAEGDEFPAIYAGFGHGTAGIGYFLIELYRHTQERYLLDLAEGGAHHIVSTAHENQLGLHWTWYQPPVGFGATWMYTWQHGTFGMAHFIDSLARATAQGYWKQIFKRIMGPALSEGTEFGFDGGKAGQIDFYVQYYRLHQDQASLDRAVWIAGYLLDSSGNVKTKRGRSLTPYALGYSGLVNIGFNFLQLHDPGGMFLPFQ